MVGEGAGPVGAPGSAVRVEGWALGVGATEGELCDLDAALVRVGSFALVIKVVCGPVLGAEGAVLGAPPMRPCSSPPSPPLAADEGAVLFDALELEFDTC